MATGPRRRQVHRTLIHFDYDCFYASVFESETPSLRSQPVAVQQKQIAVTVNYEARRRGLHKLQLISEAKRICPDVVIVLGEDLTPFRNASKANFSFLKAFSWNHKCERLGFDEVFMDVSDIVQYNVHLLNPHDLSNSFFCLSKNDPTEGFAYDASKVAGCVYPTSAPAKFDFRGHIRQNLEKRGYTCTAGVSTNKLLAKLVGNLHKPNDQTTLLPPYISDNGEDNVTRFLDGHEIGKVPGIGFKMAQKIRAHVLQRPAEIDAGLVYGATKEQVLVGHVRKHPTMGPEVLERLLGGPGTPHGIGVKIWGLLNGHDDIEVGEARDVPKQISIEDSYLRLDTLDAVVKQLNLLATSLLKRMHADLLEEEEEQPEVASEGIEPIMEAHTTRRWVAYPKTLRLSTRPRPPQNPDGSRNRSFARISRSLPMPNFVFNLNATLDNLSQRLVTEGLIPLFRKLHPEKSGWNLSLINVAATNLADAASDKGGVGRDISKMFKRQDDVLQQWKVSDQPNDEGEGDAMVVEEEQSTKVEHDGPKIAAAPLLMANRGGSEDVPTPSQELNARHEENLESYDQEMVEDDSYRCHQCGAIMPFFATSAHERWHDRN
ncbi:DNA/RNA polymerase [Corynespora cassiicola Philippines]|uniref:DNA/RNA polymerase n=1 Tax=Corynespora cassiicola Philippines TaxID=1448308 RepID=A0A2T2NE25_CORCC|nr:DNA/RNA polymerase [Corynespora cassiicola Philippines]